MIEELRGVALIYEEPMYPNVGTNGKYQQSDVVYFYSPNAFDGYFRQLDRGRATCRLFFEHDQRKPPLCTSDNGLRVWSSKTALHFFVWSRSAIAAARSSGKREASAGTTNIKYLDEWVGGEPCRFVTSAWLREISIVAVGACPGTWVRVEEGPRNGGQERRAAWDCGLVRPANEARAAKQARGVGAG